MLIHITPVNPPPTPVQLQIKQPVKALDTSHPLDFTVVVKNRSRQPVVLPDSWVPYDSFRILVYTKKGRRVKYLNWNVDAAVSWTAMDTYKLLPSESKSFDTIVKKCGVILNKPGRYTVKVVSGFCYFNDHPPAGLWTGGLLSPPMHIYIHRATKKKPTHHKE